MFKALALIFTSSALAFSLVFGTYQTLLPDRPTASGYDYSQPVPSSDQRGDEWFDDSAVIGHSLMEGFEQFSKVDSNIHYFTATSLSALGTTAFSKFDLPDGGTGTLKTGLSQRQFSKIYIMLGVNEVSTSKDRFKASMTSIIELVRENQPEGIPIYILNLTPTTEARSNSSAFNLTNVQRMNEATAELCAEQQCYLVDVYTCFADARGYLPSDFSTDGVHLTAEQYRAMADYMLSHTVEER